MIDARNAIGTPVITDCPEFVRVNGTTYRVEAGAIFIPLFEGESWIDPSIWRRYTGEA